MALTADARELLNRLDALGPSQGTGTTLRQVRGARRRQRRERSLLGAPEPVANVRDISMAGPTGQMRLRVYTPVGDPPFPVLCFFHGGGWVLGDLDDCDNSCRALANATGRVVVSLDYRLAPEHPYPAALRDAHTAILWIAAHAEEVGGNGQPIAVAGDSAGGNLAAAVCLLARDEGMPQPAQQILIYPALDPIATNDSYRRYAEGYGLTRDAMLEFWAHYLPEQEAPSPYAAPLRADRLSDLAPALIVIAECDVLRDEAASYADRLDAAGVPVRLSRYAGQVHGFWSYPDIVADAAKVTDEIALMLSEQRPEGAAKRACSTTSFGNFIEKSRQ